MHNMNVKGMVFTGKAGYKAINQILKAKPVKNKYTTSVKERSEQFVKIFNSISSISTK